MKKTLGKIGRKFNIAAASACSCANHIMHDNCGEVASDTLAKFIIGIIIAAAVIAAVRVAAPNLLANMFDRVATEIAGLWT